MPRTRAGALMALLVTTLTASAAAAVPVSLPTATIDGAGTVDMSIGTVSNLAALAVSFTYDSSIVNVPGGGVSVPGGSVVSTCNAPSVSIETRACPDA